MRKNATLLVALFSLSAFAGAAPPKAPEASDTDSSKLKSSVDVDRVKTDAQYRKQVAADIVAFIREDGFYNKETVADDQKLRQGDPGGDFWAVLQGSLEKELVKPSGPKQGAVIEEVLSRKKGEKLAAADELKSYRIAEGQLRTINDAQNGVWVDAFMQKASQASTAILKGEKYNPGDLAKSIKQKLPVGAPSTGNGGSLPGDGDSAVGADAGSMYEGLLPDVIYNTSDHRKLSIRFYADYQTPDQGAGDGAGAGSGSAKGKKGAKAPASQASKDPADASKPAWTYRIGIFDITDPTDISGVYVPIKGHGDAKFTLTDAKGQGHDYTINYAKGVREAADKRPWANDTQITIAEPKVKNEGHQVWLNDLVYERAESAKAGGRVAYIGGEKYYVTPQGGAKAGLLFYNAADVKEMLQGKVDPRRVVPDHVAYTNEAQVGAGGRFGDKRIDDSVPVSGSKFELAFDPISKVWVLQPKKVKPAAPGAKPAAAAEDDSTDAAPAKPEKSAPKAAPGPDAGYPDEAPGMTQDGINNYLSSENFNYRLYDDAKGRVFAMTKDDKGNLVPFQGGNAGKPAALVGGASGKMDHMESLLVFTTDDKNHFMAGSDPNVEIGFATDLELVLKNADFAHEALSWRHLDKGGTPLVKKIYDAMNRKLSELGGDFVSLRGVRDSNGVSTYFLETSKTGGQTRAFYDTKTGEFTGDEAPAAAAPGAPSGGKPKSVPTQYARNEGGSAPSFQNEVTLADSLTKYRLRSPLTGSETFAVYLDSTEPGKAQECVVNWRLLDSSGRPSDNYTGNIQVFHQGQAGENPCTSPGWIIRPLQVSDAVMKSKTLTAKWKNGSLGFYKRGPSASNKDDGYLGAVIEKAP